MSDMNEEFGAPSEAPAPLAAAPEPVMNESVQKVMEDSVEKSRTAYEKGSETLKATSKEYEKVLETAKTGFQKISEQMVSNFDTNSKAAFEFFGSLSGTKSLPELSEAQAAFIKEQMERMSKQGKDLYELSQEVTTETMKLMNKAAEKASKDFAATN